MRSNVCDSITENFIVHQVVRPNILITFLLNKQQIVNSSYFSHLIKQTTKLFINNICLLKECIAIYTFIRCFKTKILRKKFVSYLSRAI